MPDEVLKALETLSCYCLSQDSCSDCPMKEQCGKLPSEFFN